ncbi:hypothetical protein ACFQ88_29050 [Paenibacillus sp. NPDC056579]|uniref:hypothetical protein n=1 Tax=unclassified Paenibacillus TaxID=185978 RepID=UPI001EF995EA|nr:hypothetical protein [Paenibacillus sp. H1-7]ULL19243.1 hypothetical protein DVH26_35395 [Paenibacillus sp. H1-7]
MRQALDCERIIHALGISPERFKEVMAASFAAGNPPHEFSVSEYAASAHCDLLPPSGKRHHIVPAQLLAVPNLAQDTSHSLHINQLCIR